MRIEIRVFIGKNMKQSVFDSVDSAINSLKELKDATEVIDLVEVDGVFVEVDNE